mgnify:CR=1 FL=1
MKATTLTRDEALRRILAAEPEIRAFGVRRLALFGSVLRGEAHIDSDVDLLVEFHPGAKNYNAFLDLCEFLEACLGKTGGPGTRESLSPFVGPHILSEAQDVLRAA